MSVLRRRLMMANQGEPVLVFYDTLVFDGTAYIETNYVLPENCTVSVLLGNETQQAAQGVFMAYDGTGYLGLHLGGSTSSSKGRQTLVYYDTTTYLVSNRYLAFSNTTYAYFCTPYRYGWGGASYTFTKGSSHPTTPLILGKNNASTAQPYTGTMGTFRVGTGATRSGTTSYAKAIALTTVATFRPCTYYGEAGFWRVETNTFYGNTAGSGTLSVR